MSSVIFRQAGSNRQFSRLKMLTDKCLQLHFLNFQRMKQKYYGNLDAPIRKGGDLILAQRGNTVVTNYMIRRPQWNCNCDFSL